MDKLFSFLKLDQYDVEAVLMPSIICCILVCCSIYPFINWDIVYLKLGFVTTYTLTLIVLMAFLSVIMKIVRTFSKRFVEQIQFGENQEHMPTTEYLMLTSDFGNPIIRDKVRAKIKADFQITLKSRSVEEKDRKSAQVLISGAVALIRKQLQKLSLEMYNRKNRRYGGCRNLIGASYISFIVAIVCAVVAYCNQANYMYPLLSLGVSTILALYLHFIYRGLAEDYANELYESYLTL